MDKTAGCQLLPGCPDIECLDPFVLARAEGQCCPTCEAPVNLSMQPFIRPCGDPVLGLHRCRRLP